MEAVAVGNSVHDMVKGLAGDFSITVGEGKLRGAEIPIFRKSLQDWFDIDSEGRPSSEDPLTMPLLGLEAAGTLKRGIIGVDDGRLAFAPGLGGQAEAHVDGTLDLLLWIAELTLSIDRQDIEKEPMTFKIIGRPSRPQGFVVDQ